ncbi:MAG: fasciclin domain-containing protein [Methanomicrobiaceae archaeon]|nr:fasciclin domain-containing protein [Methanomicrobiaceae archaeon]
MRRMVCVQLCVLALLALAALSGIAAAQEPQGATVVECAAAQENITTLVSLVDRTGLNETLSDETANFTLFAPTDDAFAQLPPDVDELLINSTDSEVLLPEVLLYHVIEGTYSSSDLVEIGVIESMQGEHLVFNSTMDGNMTVNEVNVTTPDIPCGNGVVHVIEGVVLPSIIPQASDENVTAADESPA